MKLSTKRVNNHPLYRLCSDKGIECCVGLIWRFFREEGTAVKGAAADVVRPVPPHSKHVIPRPSTRWGWLNAMRYAQCPPRSCPTTKNRSKPSWRITST